MFPLFFRNSANNIVFLRSQWPLAPGLPIYSIMQTSKLLQYLLFALVGVLVVVAGYKACGSSGTDDPDSDISQSTRAVMRSSGISTPEPEVSATAPEVDAPSVPVPTQESPAAAPPPTAEPEIEKPVRESETPAPKTEAPRLKSEKAAVPPKQQAASAPAPKKSKQTTYRVQAGAFGNIENARKRLKEVVGLGYPDAEIVKSDNNLMHLVVAKQTDDKKVAEEMAAKLRSKGIKDALARTN
jgi:cell division protein FtsN